MQFAGFSDLAIGMGLLWGIRVMENFNYPFLATNMQGFWTRWHISLSSWCKDYVFQPILAFSRNRWIALIAAMLVLALWHEISLRYILWGVFHSSLILLAVLIRKKSPLFSNYINHHYFGRWLGRLWVLHAFAFSCLFLIIKDPFQLSLKLNLLFKWCTRGYLNILKSRWQIFLFFAGTFFCYSWFCIAQAGNKANSVTWNGNVI